MKHFLILMLIENYFQHLRNISYGYDLDNKTVWLDDVTCTGSEALLWMCPFNGWGLNTCYSNRVVELSCCEYHQRHNVSNVHTQL